MSAKDGNMVLGPGEGKMVPVPGHRITHKMSGADTDGAYSLLEVELSVTDRHNTYTKPRMKPSMS